MTLRRKKLESEEDNITNLRPALENYEMNQSMMEGWIDWIARLFVGLYSTIPVVKST